MNLTRKELKNLFSVSSGIEIMVSFSILWLLINQSSRKRSFLALIRPLFCIGAIVKPN